MAAGEKELKMKVLGGGNKKGRGSKMRKLNQKRGKMS